MIPKGGCKLRRFDGQPEGEERLLALLRCTGGHVGALHLRQLPAALDLAALFAHLPGCAALAALRPALLPWQPVLPRARATSLTGWLGSSGRRELARARASSHAGGAVFPLQQHRMHMCSMHRAVWLGAGCWQPQCFLFWADRGTAAAQMPMVPRRLRALALVYGRRAVSMDYERALFGMRLAACRALAQVHAPPSFHACGLIPVLDLQPLIPKSRSQHLAHPTEIYVPATRAPSACGARRRSTAAHAVQALPSAPNLARLDLSGNLLEDDKARLLADGLARAHVTHLSLAHNRARPNTREAPASSSSTSCAS